MKMAKYKIIKDCDGKLLYRKIVEDDSHYEFLKGRQTANQNRDESLVSDWESTGTAHISRRVDRNFSQYSQYRKEYRCSVCKFSDNTLTEVRHHLQAKHGINVDVGSSKRCHACDKEYNKLYKAERYHGWGDDKRREHHWKICKYRLERAESHIPASLSAPQNNIFDTRTLSQNTRDELLNSLNKKCQETYVDSITTAYRSDIMKEIMIHDN
jgi:hypothetical protein